MWFALLWLQNSHPNIQIAFAYIAFPNIALINAIWKEGKIKQKICLKQAKSEGKIEQKERLKTKNMPKKREEIDLQVQGPNY